MNMQYITQMMQMIRNPQQMMQRMGIPQDVTNNPQDVENYLLNSGRVTNEQIQQAKNMYQQIFGGAQR